MLPIGMATTNSRSATAGSKPALRFGRGVKASHLERRVLFEALDELDAGRDLLVLDRSYVGNTMVASLAQRGLGCCLRADTQGWRCVADFLRSGVREAGGAAGCAARCRDFDLRDTAHTDPGAPAMLPT